MIFLTPKFATRCQAQPLRRSITLISRIYYSRFLLALLSRNVLLNLLLASIRRSRSVALFQRQWYLLCLLFLCNASPSIVMMKSCSPLYASFLQFQRESSRTVDSEINAFSARLELYNGTKVRLASGYLWIARSVNRSLVNAIRRRYHCRILAAGSR